jgi:hypothetical protein
MKTDRVASAEKKSVGEVSNQQHGASDEAPDNTTQI